MDNPAIKARFDSGILHVDFMDNATITAADLQKIYSLANGEAAGKKCSVLFNAHGHYTVTDDAIEYMIDNPNNSNVTAKAYVIQSKESATKTKLHLIFDKPELKPFTFPTPEEAIAFLKSSLN